VAPIPQHPRQLIEQVKAYERATIKAALAGDRQEAIDALALNPLVPSRQKAAQLVEALL